MEALSNVRLRGSLSATEVVGDKLHLWFDSPTGDTSDSQIFALHCRSEAEAREVEGLHRQTWGLDPVDYEAIDAYRKEQTEALMASNDQPDIFG